MARYAVLFGAVGVAVPVFAFLLSVWVPLFPLPVFALVLFFCPSYAWFIATARCEPFDSCSMQMLAWVGAANLALYLALAAVFWYTRQKYRGLRFTIVALTVTLSVWWVKLWVW
jgi:hypothetical protein